MKIANTLILLIIALAAGYLAYSKYQERRAMEEAAEALANPDAYLAKTWAARADLDCESFLDVETRQTPGAGPLPTRFTCYADTGMWTIEERECTDNAAAGSHGSPIQDGQLFKPLYALCWIATKQTN